MHREGQNSLWCCHAESYLVIWRLHYLRYNLCTSASTLRNCQCKCFGSRWNRWVKFEHCLQSNRPNSNVRYVVRQTVQCPIFSQRIETYWWGNYLYEVLGLCFNDWINPVATESWYLGCYWCRVSSRLETLDVTNATVRCYRSRLESGRQTKSCC